jgi:site-specific recombinase XerD
MLRAQAPVYVSDFTPAHLLAWRNTWAFEDTSAAQAWNRVRGFFNFRWKQGMIGENPAAKCEPLKATKGNRTGVFTDEQYKSIVKACDEFDDFRFPLVSRQLLHCFLELSRWSGMDLIEMVAYG